MAELSAPVPWTVVSHAADDSPPAVAASHLMAWLARQPSVSLHTVLWASGPAGTEPYDLGTFTDVGAAHRRVVPRALRGVGLTRLGGGLAGRAVRTTLRDTPRSGVLYLGSARAGAVLRYLPPGERTVVTHLHAMDRHDPPLPEDKVAALTTATDVWLAVDEETRSWAAETWGLDADDIAIVPEAVDPSTWNRAMRVTDRDELRLGLCGASWFRSDHAGRLVQRLLRLRPELRLVPVWTEAVRLRDHLAPLLHDLDRLGVADAVVLPSEAEDMAALLHDVDVLAMTAPDHPDPWAAWEATRLGVPIVCFDTHRVAPTLDDRTGVVVPYLDVVAMADAVLAIHDDDATAPSGFSSRRSALRQRDVAVVGTRVLELVEEVRA